MPGRAIKQEDGDKKSLDSVYQARTHEVVVVVGPGSRLACPHRMSGRWDDRRTVSKLMKTLCGTNWSLRMPRTKAHSLSHCFCCRGSIKSNVLVATVPRTWSRTGEAKNPPVRSNLRTKQTKSTTSTTMPQHQNNTRTTPATTKHTRTSTTRKQHQPQKAQQYRRKLHAYYINSRRPFPTMASTPHNVSHSTSTSGYTALPPSPPLSRLHHQGVENIPTFSSTTGLQNIRES